MTTNESQTLLKPILEKLKQETFVAGYQASDEEAIGLLVSKFFEWDGHAVIRASLHGLEDSNWPMLAWNRSSRFRRRRR